MTSGPDTLSRAPATRPTTVALLGLCGPSPAALNDALAALTGAAVAWSIASADALPAGADVQIVVCDADLVTAAGGRWPAAAIVAHVADRDDGYAVVRAIEDGANVCVRGRDARLVAAFVQSVARRRIRRDGPVAR
jgi:hypothetical protein